MRLYFAMRDTYKPNFVPSNAIFQRRSNGDDHSSRPYVAARLERPTRKRCRSKPTLGRAARSRFPIWSCTTRSLPGHRVSPPMPVSSYLTVSPITASGWSILCCTCRHSLLHECPDVIRLAALWCSDFPLRPRPQRPSSMPHS